MHCRCRVIRRGLSGMDMIVKVIKPPPKGIEELRIHTALDHLLESLGRGHELIKMPLPLEGG